MSILDCVEVWVHSLHGVFDSAGIAVRFNRTVDQRPNASCVFNLRHDVTEADLVVWESGEADLSVIEADGATKQEHFDDLSDTKELAAVLSRVAKLML
jgi:hypothetical protein